jgi:hypothetical protein
MSDHRVAILWRGDSATRAAATPQNNRYRRIFEELEALGIHAEPAVYADDMRDEVRQQLMTADGVLVWVNPLDGGLTRSKLDPMLREVASKGPWVSAHPDVILKMGVKEVLHRTKHFGWGTDTNLYRTVEEFRDRFPALLAKGGAHVLKQNRGNAGQGIWRVERVNRAGTAGDVVTVLEARHGSVPEQVALQNFMMRCEDYFAAGGCIVDQPFQSRLREGMIRCYMGAHKVVGFGHQLIKALMTPPPEGPNSPVAQSGPRIMHGPAAPAFQTLRAKMENEWTPQLMQTLDIDAGSLPIIWDADFLYGPRTTAGEDTYVLCEINVSCVFAVPDEAPAAIARLAQERCSQANSRLSRKG